MKLTQEDGLGLLNIFQKRRDYVFFVQLFSNLNLDET